MKYQNTKWLSCQLALDRSTKDIAQECGVGYATICKWICKLNLTPYRDKSYQDKNWLIEQYCVNRRYIKEIAKECGTSRSSIIYWVIKYNLKRRRLTSYDVNESYFETIDTSEKAYWLGFIAADGCVMNNVGNRLLTITLANKDKDHLELFKKCIQSNHLIHDRKYGGCQLDITREKMVRDLIKHGIVPRKSLVLKPPKLLNRFISHWIRGYFDGDGSISNCANGNTCGQFFGTKEVIEFVAYNIPANTQARRVKSVKSGCACRFGGPHSTKRMKEYLYNGANGLYLERKYQKF